MKKALIISVLFLLFCSCAAKKEENPLIIPPNFAELPDPKVPESEDLNDASQEEDVARLKELLLKSD